MEILIGFMFGIVVLYIIDVFNNLFDDLWIKRKGDDK